MSEKSEENTKSIKTRRLVKRKISVYTNGSSPNLNFKCRQFLKDKHQKTLLEACKLYNVKGFRTLNQSKNIPEQLTKNQNPKK